VWQLYKETAHSRIPNRLRTVAYQTDCAQSHTKQTAHSRIPNRLRTVANQTDCAQSHTKQTAHSLIPNRLRTVAYQTALRCVDAVISNVYWPADILLDKNKFGDHQTPNFLNSWRISLPIFSVFTWGLRRRWQSYLRHWL